MTQAAQPRVTQGPITSPIYRFRGQRSRWFYPNADRLTPEHAILLRNVNLSEADTALTRKGYTTFNSTQITASVEALTGLYQADFITHGVQQVETTATRVFADDGTTRKDITGTVLGGSATDEDRMRMIFLKDQIIGNNGVDPPWVWAGDYTTPTNAAALGGVTFDKCVDIVRHKNVIVVLGPTMTAGGQYFPADILWNDIDTTDFSPDITNWPSTNRYKVYEDAHPLVGGIENFGQLLLFKADGLYPGTLSSQTGFIEFLPSDPQLGFEPLAKHSLVARPGFVFGVAREGAFIIRPDLSFELVTSDVEDAWKGLNQARLQYAVSWPRAKDHQIRTLLSSSGNSTGHDLVMVWDWETGDVWFDAYDTAFNHAAQLVSSNVEYDWLGSTDGYVYQGNDSAQSTDNGTDITWTIQLHPNDLGSPGRTKTIHNARVYYRTPSALADFTLTLQRDQGALSERSTTLSVATDDLWNDGGVWDDGGVWAGAGQAPKEFFFNRQCETVAPTLTGTDPVELVGIQYEYTLEE